MNRNVFRFGAVAVAVFVLLFVLVSPGTTDDADTAVTIYGSDNCGLCTSLRAELDRRGRDYTFYDIQVDQSAFDEAVDIAIGEPWFQGGIPTPMVVIGEEVLVQPSADEVETEL